MECFHLEVCGSGVGVYGKRGVKPSRDAVKPAAPAFHVSPAAPCSSFLISTEEPGAGERLLLFPEQRRAGTHRKKSVGASEQSLFVLLNIYIFEQHGAKKGFLGEEKGFFSLSGKKKSSQICGLNETSRPSEESDVI